MDLLDQLTAPASGPRGGWSGAWKYALDAAISSAGSCRDAFPQQVVDVDAAAAHERTDQVVVRDDAAGPEHVLPALMTARLAVHQRAVEVEDGGLKVSRLPG